MTSNIENKITDITNESLSQIERSEIGKLSSQNLLNFLNGYINKITAKDSLKEKVENMLRDKLEADEEDIPYGVLIKLLEVLSKAETDTATPLLKIIEAVSKQSEQGLLPGDTNGSGQGKEKYTEKEYSEAKKLLEMASELAKTEFTEKE